MIQSLSMCNYFHSEDAPAMLQRCSGDAPEMLAKIGLICIAEGQSCRRMQMRPYRLIVSDDAPIKWPIHLC